MKTIITSIILVLLAVQILSAKSDEDRAIEKIMHAITLMDNGEVDSSLSILEKAQKLDPDNILIPYEMAYAYYMKSEFHQTIEIIESVIEDEEAQDLFYQLLGNSYSMSGERDEAISVYEAGLERFPNSGSLYLERGNMEMFVGNYLDALSYYETGIKRDPAFPSNYFWAAQIFFGSTEEVWGMIYGEIFMNLERNSQRTAEISELLYDVYDSEIQFNGDTSIIVSFSKMSTINLTDISDLESFKLPFGVGVYEPTLILSLIGQNSINLSSLNKIRKNFVDLYFENEHHLTYPNVLFDYQKRIKDAGHMEAYNHWLLMKGDEAGFELWLYDNEDKYYDFVDWFIENPLVLNDDNRFYRTQY